MRGRSRSAERRDLDSLRCEPRWAKSGTGKEHTAGCLFLPQFHTLTTARRPHTPPSCQNARFQAPFRNFDSQLKLAVRVFPVDRLNFRRGQKRMLNGDDDPSAGPADDNGTPCRAAIRFAMTFCLREPGRQLLHRLPYLRISEQLSQL
jgi:hypothetical protein